MAHIPPAQASLFLSLESVFGVKIQNFSTTVRKNTKFYWTDV
nr:MAG TPA_asm: hypothetical protein [Caudoviricetes sp.]